MTNPLRILMIVHGFPPRETAGTEQHALQLRTSLIARGHAVHVLSATRSPGAHQYSLETQDGVTRVVNNVTTRRLADAEQDATMDKIAREVALDFRPDIVHIHHIQFLSSTMRFDAPVVVTLHDRWGWCAAGGLGMRPGDIPCHDAQPADCATCASAWRPTPGTLAQGMQRTAQALSPLIRPDILHGLYKRIPARLRPRPERGRGPIESASDAERRNRIVGDLYRSADVRISPSHHLAREAETHGLGPVKVIPHGVPDDLHAEPVTARGPLAHLGTISRHKGTDRVVEAWREVCPTGAPELLLHGPIAEGDAALGHPVGPVLDRSGVAALLARSRALVLAPRWAENAPLVALEARAMGCPVIAPASGGFPELIEDGVDGILYSPTAKSGLKEALKVALSGPLPTPRKPPKLSDQVDAIEQVYRDLLLPEADRCA